MVIYSARTDMALVFDDGPNPKITPKILDVLTSRGVPANFFIVGMRAEAAPDLVQKIADAGHEIDNHSYTHKRLSKLLQASGPDSVIEEIQKGAAAIKNIVGIEPTFFRPPYLDWDEPTGIVARPFYGDRIILSGTKSGDYAWGQDHVWDVNDSEAISRKASVIFTEWSDIPAGTILGLHDSAEYNLPGNDYHESWENRALPTLEALPRLIDTLKRRGFTFKKLSDMDLITEALRVPK